jgi:hypothetical protein
MRNFMGGQSYKQSPLTTLRMVAASAIFGENLFYLCNKASNLNEFLKNPYLGHFDSTEDVFAKVVNDALSYDFGRTLDFAIKLRHEYEMRLNPQVIYVMACAHPDRSKFTAKNPGKLAEVGRQVTYRIDDAVWQYQYWKGEHGNFSCLPNPLKKNWTDRLVKAQPYEVVKYKEIAGRKELINVARLANTRRIRELNPAMNIYMETGTLKYNERQTWERFISENGSNSKTWCKVLHEFFERDGKPSNHMALLRNLRNLETHCPEEISFICDLLERGVENGRQFPFRYWTAMNAVNNDNLKTALEHCIDISVKNVPSLSGKTACLCDNSGSAWGTTTSEYGTVQIAKIANLSGIITCKKAEDGKYFVFGDKLIEIKTNNCGTFEVLKRANAKRSDVGGATETGMWTFWNQAINDKKYWDNVFIYSDQQAGHMGLYGDIVHGIGNRGTHTKDTRAYIDLQELVNEYRQKVNPRVNVFSVQVAGYSDAVLPELSERCAVLAGWTGREVIYAKEMIEAWDQFDLDAELE